LYKFKKKTTYFKTNFSIIKPIVKKAIPTIKKFQLINSGKFITKLTPSINIPNSSDILSRIGMQLDESKK
jgi:hypothetical protein